MPTFENNTFVAKKFTFISNCGSAIDMFCEGVVCSTQEFLVGHKKIIEIIRVDFDLKHINETIQFVCQPHELYGISSISKYITPTPNSMFEFKFSVNERYILLWGVILDGYKIEITKAFETRKSDQFGIMVNFSLDLNEQLCDIMIQNAHYQVVNPRKLEDYLTIV